MKRLVCGVGVNDSDCITQKVETVYRVDGKQKQIVVWRCPFYETWVGMLKRCFSETFKAKYPTYKDATCCSEWLVFSNFKHWMEQQDWEGKQLDKDIIFPNNKLYSAETCAFIFRNTNTFVIECGRSRGEHPLGVCWSSKEEKYQADCRNPFAKRGRFLGYFDCPQEAHEAWRKRKHEIAQLVAETESDPRVVEALKKRYSVEEWYGNKT